MAVMGMKQNRTSTEMGAETLAAHSFDEFVQDGRLLDADFGTFLDLYLSTSLYSNISPIGGPTPKRTKTRKSLKSSVAHHSKAFPGTAGRKGTKENQRRPLKDLGFSNQNQEGSTPTQHLSSKYPQSEHIHRNKDLGMLCEDENFQMDKTSGSFDDSDIFTSTDQHQYDLGCERVRTDIYDDTTVDI